MKVKFIGKVVFISKNRAFTPGEDYEVDIKLVNKFPNMFEKLEAEKPKTVNKPKPKGKPAVIKED